MVDVAPDMTLGTLKAVLESDINIPIAKQTLFFNNRPLPDDWRTISGVGMREGDMITVTEFQTQPTARQQPSTTAQQQQLQQPRSQGTQIQQPSRDGTGGLDHAEILRQSALADPSVMARLRERSAELAAAVPDPRRFREELNRLQSAARAVQREKAELEARLEEDSFDVEAQRKIEEIIRKQNLQANLEHALEHTPEGEFDLDLEVECFLGSGYGACGLFDLTCQRRWCLALSVLS